MIIGKNKEGKDVLLRCGCSHDWKHDYEKYGYDGPYCANSEPTENTIVNVGSNVCQKCGHWGWRITGMTDEKLRRREID